MMLLPFTTQMGGLETHYPTTGFSNFMYSTTSTFVKYAAINPYRGRHNFEKHFAEAKVNPIAVSIILKNTL
jgi:hypothetical protein